MEDDLIKSNATKNNKCKTTIILKMEHNLIFEDGRRPKKTSATKKNEKVKTMVVAPLRVI
jgi:hypothetical protein